MITPHDIPHPSPCPQEKQASLQAALVTHARLEADASELELRVQRAQATSARCEQLRAALVTSQRAARDLPRLSAELAALRAKRRAVERMKWCGAVSL